MTPDTPPFATLFNSVRVHLPAFPGRAWALFLDRTQWMDSFRSERWISGPPHEPGSVMAVASGDAATGQRTERFEQVLAAERPRRFAVRIWMPGAAFLAHADFQFAGDADGTWLTATIHGVLPPDTPADTLRALARQTEAKIGADFARLAHVAGLPPARPQAAAGDAPGG